MKKPVLYFFPILALISLSTTLFAQVAAISYNTPQLIVVGSSASFSPTNTGGAVPATTYGMVSTFVSSGLNNPKGIASDAAGNIYIADFNSNKIYKTTTAGVTSVLAGSGTASSVDNTGALATFNGPAGIVYDGSTYLYVTDYNGNKIRRITVSTGVVTTIAGSGTAAETQGTGVAAAFNHPYGITSDGTNLYISDFVGNTVRKLIISTNVVSNEAGSGTAAETNGNGAAAAFNGPTGLVYSSSAIYVTDATGNTVRKIATGGGRAVSTIVSSGLSAPSGIGLDPVTGNLIIADKGNNVIKTCTIAGASLTTLAGDGTQMDVDGVTTAAEFYSPYAVISDGLGNMFTADNNGTSSTIRKITFTGYTINTTLPAGLTFTSSTGVISGTPTVETAATTYTIKAYNSSGAATAATIIITTTAVPVLTGYTGSGSPYDFPVNTAITSMSPVNTGGTIPANAYNTVSTYSGSTTGSTDGAVASAKFKGPSDVTIDNNGTIFIADAGNNRIRKILAGTVSILSGSAAGAPPSYTNPTGVVTNGLGNVFVADNTNHDIRKVIIATNAASVFAGSSTQSSGSTDSPTPKFKNPKRICIDALGNFYVIDAGNNKIRKITAAGVVSTIAGSGATGSADNGTGTSATFSNLSGIAIDAAGYLYVADKGNHKIRKISTVSPYPVTPFAGSGVSSSVDGTGVLATFTSPNGITIDRTGNLYVSDGGSTSSNKIRMITPAGVVTTIAGTGAVGSTNGVGTVALFSTPGGLDVDPVSGNILVADSANFRIRQIIGTGYSISPTLPTGLVFSATTGIISGTPTVASAATTYTITAFNAAGSSSTQLNITTSLQDPGISYTTPVSFVAGSVISPTPTPIVSGSPVVTTTLAYTNSPTQPLTGGTYSGPGRMEVDASGNIYVLDRTGNSVKEYTSSGTLITNSYGTGNPAFSSPDGIVFDPAGNCYILNGGVSPGTIYKFDSTGAYKSTITLTGSTTTSGLAIDPTGDILYITNYSGTTTSSYAVYKYTLSTSTLLTAYINPSNTARLYQPVDVATDATGNIYVLNLANNGAAAGFVSRWTPGTLTGTFSAANVFLGYTGALSLKIDPTNQYMYVADMPTTRAVKVYLGSANAFATATGALTISLGTTANCRGIIPDRRGSIYVSDLTAKTISKYTPNGRYFVDKPFPSGLSMVNTTGVISGTPTAGVSSVATDYTVTAWNAAGGGSTAININIYQIKSWTGTSSGVWALTGNWTGGIPSSADRVTFNGNYANLPVISSPVTIGSLVFGTPTGTLQNTLNISSTLTVTGDITYQSDAQSFRNTVATFSGTGSVSATNLNIISNVVSGTNSYTATVASSISNLNLSGNITLTSSKPTVYTLNSVLNVTGGSVTAAGGLQVSNAAGSTSTVTVSGGTLSIGGAIQTTNNSTGASVISVTGGTLKLADPDPLSGLTANNANANTLTLGASSTLEYSGADQNVYSDSTLVGQPAGLSYGSLAFSGSGIKNVTSGTVNITGNFTNNMVSNTTNKYADFSSATAKFSGTTQTLTDASTSVNGGAGTTFYNATFSGLGTKTIASGKFNIASSGVLTMSGTSTSTILAAGSKHLTLLSDSTGSAMVDSIKSSGPTITGSIYVQRFVSGKNNLLYRGYRLFSSPVADTVSTAFNNLTFLKGSGSYLTGASGGGFDGTGNPTTFLYREDQTPNTGSFTSGNYRAVTAINGSPTYSIGTIDANKSLPIGNGILSFFRGNNGTSTSTPPSDVTLIALGRLNQGQVTVKPWFTGLSNLSYTTALVTDPRYPIRGFNLVGNPYPSSIDWNKAYADSTSTYGIYAPNVDPTIYIYNAKTKNYDTYMNTGVGAGSGTNGMTNIIPAGQGFFVRALNASAKLIFNETAKVNDQPDFLLLNAVTTNVQRELRVQLIKDAINKDETVIVFNKDAHTTYVVNEDALYLKGIGPVSLSNRSSDSSSLAINQLPFPSTSQVIPLTVTVTSTGTYKLHLGAQNIPGKYDIWLKDNYLRDSVNFKNDTSYSFSVTGDAASTGAARFSVVIRQNNDFTLHLLSFTAQQNINDVKLNWTTDNEENYTRFTIERSIDNGANFIGLDSLTSNGEGDYNAMDQHPVAGLNQYRIKIVDINGNVTYSSIANVTYSKPAPAYSIIKIAPNPVVSTIHIYIGSGLPIGRYKITLINSSGRVVKTIISPKPWWVGDISRLLPGTYFVQVVNEKNNAFIGRNSFIKL